MESFFCDTRYMAISCKIVTVFLGRNTINYNFPHNTNKQTNKVSLSIFVEVHGTINL